MEVFVFKTNVKTRKDASGLEPQLNQALNKKSEWNFDLKDCDCILRVENPNVKAVKLIEILKNNGYDCIELV